MRLVYEVCRTTAFRRRHGHPQSGTSGRRSVQLSVFSLGPIAYRGSEQSFIVLHVIRVNNFDIVLRHVLQRLLQARLILVYWYDDGKRRVCVPRLGTEVLQY